MSNTIVAQFTARWRCVSDVTNFICYYYYIMFSLQFYADIRQGTTTAGLSLDVQKHRNVCNAEVTCEYCVLPSPSIMQVLICKRPNGLRNVYLTVGARAPDSGARRRFFRCNVTPRNTLDSYTRLIYYFGIHYKV